LEGDGGLAHAQDLGGLGEAQRACRGMKNNKATVSHGATTLKYEEAMNEV
jgi:hypothetical protein